MEAIAKLVELLQPWQSLYADSTAVSTTVMAIHLTTLMIGGGLAIAADRMTLRALRRSETDRALALAEMRSVHRPILVALALLFVSGAALAAADLEVFLSSPVFWVKLGLLALLLVNGAVLVRTEARLGGTPVLNADALWRRLGLTARLSLSLWLLTAVVGTVLTGVA